MAVGGLSGRRVERGGYHIAQEERGLAGVSVADEEHLDQHVTRAWTHDGGYPLPDGDKERKRERGSEVGVLRELKNYTH